MSPTHSDSTGGYGGQPAPDAGPIPANLVGHIKHQLRTPINHIIGFSELLFEEAVDRSQDYFIPDLEKIRAAGARLLKLVDEELELAQLAAGMLDLNQVGHELRTALNAIIGYSELLHEEAVDQGQHHFVPDLLKIRGAGACLLEMVNALLGLSKTDAWALEMAALPHAAAAPGLAPSSPRRPQPAGPPPEHGSLLVVDDNEMNREVLARRLERLGYMVAGASSGKAALELLETSLPELILLDVMMPEMNGQTVLARLKADPRLWDIPVIVLSAFEELESVVTCIELGAEDYLPTPFNPVLLEARISASLEKKRLREQEQLYLKQIADERERSEERLRVQLRQTVQELQAIQAQMIEKEKLERELQVARLIQHALLPKEVPDLPGWEVAAHYQPARTVGGDFYDFLPLPDGRFGVVIGDATDKGVPAALVMATARSILRGAAHERFSPGEVLARANDLLCPDMPAHMFVTCLYAILDPASGRLQYANAGHDLPYWRRDGSVAELRARGMPLGLMPGAIYEEREAMLAPGESVLLYTDGIVEAHNTRHEMFSFPRLRELLGQHRAGDGPVIHCVLHELDRFTGAEWEQEDDITLITLRRSSAEESSLDAHT